MEKERILILLKSLIFTGLFFLIVFDPGNKIEYMKIGVGAMTALIIDEGKKEYDKKKEAKKAETESDID